LLYSREKCTFTHIHSHLASCSNSISCTVETIVGIAYSAAAIRFVCPPCTNLPSRLHYSNQLQNAYLQDLDLFTKPWQAGKVCSTPFLACQPQTPGQQSNRLQYVMAQSNRAQRSTYQTSCNRTIEIAIENIKVPNSLIAPPLPLENPHVLPITHPMLLEL
jgi:predicted RNA-binding Zn-ribbon protein involved in translation (DUF1610 family)